MKPIGCALATFVLVLVAAAVHGQTAERPTWKVGYKWAYHEVSGLPPVESDWTREVTEPLPEGQFSVRTETGKTLVFDGEGNRFDSRGPEYSWMRFSFPLFVGKKWTHRRQIGVPPHNGYEDASWEVKAYESVTVPAGTFECFRVEGTAWWGISYTLYGQGVGHQDETYWYCPAIKWTARLKTHRKANQYSPFIDSDLVLTSFVGD